MDLSDWALIIFTILMQMAVGSLLVLQVIHYYVSRKASAEEADQLINLASLALVPVVGVALLASLFHLKRESDQCAASDHSPGHLLVEP